MTSQQAQPGANRYRISQGTLHQIAVGDLVTYLLTPEMLPSNPLREWHGRVEQLTTQGVLVSLTDEGYIGLTEQVRWKEIISVSKDPFPST